MNWEGQQQQELRGWGLGGHIGMNRGTGLLIPPSIRTLIGGLSTLTRTTLSKNFSQVSGNTIRRNEGLFGYLFDHRLLENRPPRTTGFALLDASAAFDTVDHDILMDRFAQSFGVAGNAFNWLVSFVTGRTYAVRFGVTTTPPRKVRSGIPQGSILGPLLYIL